MVKKYIWIEELEILGKRNLLFRLFYPKRIGKYFLSDTLYVEYDADIHNVSKSILYIPLISSIITIAWAIGADIYVEELDKTFLESLNKIKPVMKKGCPKLSFSSDIYVDKIVSSSSSGEGYGLLYSGGIDSTASYVRNRNRT